jgi:hypothetical protein
LFYSALFVRFILLISPCFSAAGLFLVGQSSRAGAGHAIWVWRGLCGPGGQGHSACQAQIRSGIYQDIVRQSVHINGRGRGPYGEGSPRRVGENLCASLCLIYAGERARQAAQTRREVRTALANRTEHRSGLPVPRASPGATPARFIRRRFVSGRGGRAIYDQRREGEARRVRRASERRPRRARMSTVAGGTEPVGSRETSPDGDGSSQNRGQR